jgi:RNA polymerase sigma-70 factor (ECF subfamily)
MPGAGTATDTAALDPDPVAALVATARGGDRAAFAELYRRFAPMVHGLLLARLPPAEVPDLVQEVFLRALRHLGALRHEAAFPGWLAALARSTAADHHRRPASLRRPVALPDSLADPREPGPEAHALLDAVRSLPPAYAETLLLRLVEGMSGPEIAARTGLTPESVRVNLCRGMKLLRRTLANEPRGTER